jgi:sugar-specific transcriptional regulator TrmB
MDKDLLIKIGLTESQAKAYLALVNAGRLTPPQMAREIGESRTSAYMALGKLEEIGLAERVKDIKKQTFAPTSPSALNKYLEARRRELTEIEEEYRARLSDMLAHFYAQRRQTGVEYFQGEVGLQEMYKDIVRTGKDVYLLRTYADEDYFGDWLYEFMDDRAKAGIFTHTLVPFDIGSYSFAKKNNKRLNRETAWYPREAYTAPVEISSYGDKVAIISFGEEATGTILESPQIAKAFQQLWQMAKVGAGQLNKDKN